MILYVCNVVGGQVWFGFIIVVVIFVVSLFFWFDVFVDEVLVMLEGMVCFSEINEGVLLFKIMEYGVYVFVLMIVMDIEFDIFGLVVCVIVIQWFENFLDVWVEGIYFFLMFEDSGVDCLCMQIGDCFIEGEIYECQQVCQIYECVCEVGQCVSLVE